MKQLSENDARRVAEAWVEQYGMSLLAEGETMRAQGVSYPTPRADKVVRRVPSQQSRQQSRPARHARHRQTALITTLAAAACLLLVVWVASIPSLMAPPSTSSSDATLDSLAPAPVGAKLPLSFDLPADYRVAASDYDNGMSVYALESETRSAVVLTMYPTSEQPADATERENSFATMEEVLIDGKPVPAKIDLSYSMLTFEHEGVHYTVSNRDDMGTLAAFYRSIVRAEA
ncbi:MAG: hypothetical protein LBJ48_04600 [Coriobacteriales bacterium]|jgi:hypothetical protein|nr:hypothetical protein [Coriobacteriales bacterium]